MKIFMWFSVILLMTTCCTTVRLKRGFPNNQVVLLNFNNEQDPNQSHLIPQNCLNNIPTSGVELDRSTSIVYQNQQIQENGRQPQLLEHNQQVHQAQLVRTAQIQRLPLNSQRVIQGYPLNLQRIQQISPQLLESSIISQNQQSATERSIQRSISESIEAGNKILNGEVVLSQTPQLKQKETFQTPITREVVVPQPYQVTITKEVSQPYPVEVVREIKVPVRVPIEVPKPYEVRVPHPVPVPVTVRVPIEIPKPYPVTVTKTVHVPVERTVYVRVPHPIKVPVPEPYPVPVPQPIQVNIPTPVVVNDGGAQYINNETPAENNRGNVEDDTIVVEARSNLQSQGVRRISNKDSNNSNNQPQNLFQPNNQQGDLQRNVQNVDSVSTDTKQRNLFQPRNQPENLQRKVTVQTGNQPLLNVSPQTSLQLIRSNIITDQNGVQIDQIGQNYLPHNLIEVPTVLQTALIYNQPQIW